jgi:ubiquinone/menaquinone biosynthesis C-methylase UbiE
MPEPSSEGQRAQALDEPAVPPGAYDEHYYLHACAGSGEWRGSGGTEVSGLYAGSLAKAGFKAGEVLVDLGCGRGELVAVAVEQGATRAIGVEYSEDAIRLANQTLERHGAQQRAEIIHADARAVPLDDATADLVTLLDVVEHLTPTELDRALAEAFRILKPGGRVLVHTLPNRLIYDVTYRWQRRLVPGRRRRWPEDPRVHLERAMHVNEQTRRSLLASLRRAGFDPASVAYGEWIHDGFVPSPRARRVYRRLASIRLTRPLGAADLWGHGRRP